MKTKTHPHKQFNYKYLSLFIVAFFVLLLCKLKAQNTDTISLQCTDTIPAKAQKIYTDPLAQNYVLNQNMLIKTNTKKPLTYSNSFYGIPDVVDVSNPLKILLFYKNHNTLLCLNRDFAPGSEAIKLDYITLSEISTVATSNFGGYWLFDNSNQQLIGMDMFFNIKIHSQQGIPYVERPINPHQIVENSNSVYVVDRNTGIIIFDNYGGFQKFIPVLEIEKIAIINPRQIVYKSANILYVYSMDFDKETPIKLSISGDYDFSVAQNSLQILTNDTIFIYKIPE